MLKFSIEHDQMICRISNCSVHCAVAGLVSLWLLEEVTRSHLDTSIYNSEVEITNNSEEWIPDLGVVTS